MSQSFERIAVIDIGKTNAKVVVVDAATGTEVAIRKTGNAPVAGPPYQHFDTERLWAFILQALSDCARTPGFDAVSITTHGASAALLDETGALALPVLDYEYLYPKEVNRAYDALRPGFEATYSPRLTGGLNLGAQLHYQRMCFPDDFSRVRTIVTYPQYWAYRLTGVTANEKTSLGCHTDLWLPFEGCYSSLMADLDLTDRMAPLRSAFDVLGEIRPNVARELGLSKAIPVFCGIHDSNASLLPHLVGLSQPFSVVSTGTWVVCFAPGAKPERLDPERDTLVNVDAYGTAVPSARYMGGREWELVTSGLSEQSAEAIRSPVSDIIDEGQMLLPSGVDGTGPFPTNKGRWTSEPENSARIRASASLYQALMTQTCLEMIDADGPVIVEGPFAANQVFLAALQSLTERPVYASVSQTGTSSGAALLTGIRPASSLRPVDDAISGLQAYRSTWRARISAEAGR
jgi:sugar (pentulose or hexulose) kinase